MFFIDREIDRVRERETERERERNIMIMIMIQFNIIISTYQQDAPLCC